MRCETERIISMIEKIQDRLKEKYNLDTVVKHDELNGDNGLIKVRVEPPCSNPDCRDEQKKWLLRMAPSASFDRWSVSAAIEKRFDDPDQVLEFLCYTAMVYRTLFSAISKDYVTLSEENERLEYGEACVVNDDKWLYETGNGCWSMNGFSSTNWVTVESEDDVFNIQKKNGYNYILRHKGDRNVRQFWNQFTKKWIEGTTFVD
jgi:hypothetical protein